MRTIGDSGGPRLGIFRRTFDPPHVGHLVTAVNVRYALRPDRVLLQANNVPCKKPAPRALTPPAERLGLAADAAPDVARIAASCFEIHARGHPSHVNPLDCINARAPF